jgi:hypothetical protein
VSTMFRKSAPSRDRLVRMIHNSIGGLSMMGIAISLSISAARASDFDQRPPAHSNSSLWGSGPLAVSLIECAQREAPVRGVELTARAVHSTEFVADFHGNAVLRPAAYHFSCQPKENHRDQ